mmetsp:Transcript_38975/g.70951  ORF Transcript_38975/g.70951 Transcript_38975/m.70951 type:complete len:438 (-) Transcript_38975:143-1456(-)
MVGSFATVEEALETAEAVDGNSKELADEAVEAEEGAGTAKKSKNKKKRRAAEAAQAALAEADAHTAAAESGDVERATNSSMAALGDVEFQEWCKTALEKHASKELTQMSPEDLLKPPKPFWGYQYSGALRAAFVSPQMRMREKEDCKVLPDYATHPEGMCISERDAPKDIPVLEGAALETMKQACRYGREVLDIAARFMVPGVTGDEIDRVVFQACLDRKIYPSPLNYFRFPKSVCVSPNEVICHGIPNSRPLEDGDIVNLDISIHHEGFHSDLNETFLVGNCDEDSVRVVQTAYNSLRAASQLIKPGTLYRDLGNVIHAEAARNNCSVVTSYCGHGVGRLFHGPPRTIPHYRKNKAVGVMKPGHVFTVEPMINLGGSSADKMWPDNWTAVTKDGKRSAQFEHTFLVTETGFEILTRRWNCPENEMPPFDKRMFQRG